MIIQYVIAVLVASFFVEGLPGIGFRVRRSASEVKFKYQKLFYEQPACHFSFFNNDTFNMRYLLNDEFWDNNGGPILFYPGGEGDITWFANHTGFMWDIAPEFKAMIVFAEHRYYGESMPFGKDTYMKKSNLRYLNSEQTMADYASLLQHLKVTIPGAKSSPVIAIGGSYGGMLAAWMRMKYPHYILGSLASSAPIFVFHDMNPCGTFAEIVTKDFEDVSPICSNTIRKSWKAIENMAQTKNGKKWLTEVFHFCKPIKNKNDFSHLQNWLNTAWVNLAEVNYPYPTTFLQDLPSWPIKKACKYLTNDTVSEKQLIYQVQKAANFFYNATGKIKKCFNTSSTYNDPHIEHGWSFQTCTEMAIAFCSDNVKDIFQFEEASLNSYSDYCFNTWGVRPDIERAYRIFGGRDIQAASNIIFTNGEYDPWKGYGVLQNYSSSVISLMIKEAAHHLDIRSANEKDTPYIINVRNTIKQFFREWIKEYKYIPKNDVEPKNKSKTHHRSSY